MTMTEKQIKAARAMRDVGTTDQQIAETLGVEVEAVRESLRGVRSAPADPAAPAPPGNCQAALQMSQLLRQSAGNGRDVAGGPAVTASWRRVR